MNTRLLSFNLTEIPHFKKETENKLRWDAMVDDTPFEFYIPKWRVPYPIPQFLKVTLYFLPELPMITRQITPQMVELNPGLRKEPILTELRWFSDHTKTIRYDPVGENRQWETGSLYVPMSLLPKDKLEKIVVEVCWDRLWDK